MRVREIRKLAKVQGYALHFDGKFYSLRIRNRTIYGLTLDEASRIVS
jgi:hypothetical protein